MDTERVDTDTPLNINQNESENTPYFENQRNGFINDAVEEQSNNQTKDKSILAFQQKSRLTIEDQQSQKSNHSTKQQSQNQSIKAQTFQKILTNESASNRSQEDINKNKQLQFQAMNHLSSKNEVQKTGSFSKMQDEQNNHQNEVIESQNEKMKGSTQSNQQSEEQTRNRGISQKQQNDEHNIDYEDNNQELFESQGKNENYIKNNLVQNRKDIHQDENQSEGCNILELDEISVKQIQIPKPIVKKNIIQNIGIVKYMENSLFGKKNKQSVEKGLPLQENSKMNDMNNELPEQILIQKDSAKKPLIHQVQNAKNPNENYLNKEFEDINFNEKSQYMSSQYVYAKQQSGYRDQRQESTLERKQSQFATISLNSGKEQKSANKKMSEKLMLKEERSKKFITLKKITLVKRIIKIFEKFHILKRFTSIPLDYFRFLGDKASWLNFDNNNNIFQKIKHKMNIKKQLMKQQINQDNEEIISKLVLFQDNKFVIFFKILVIICSVLQCIYIPTEIAFSNSFEPTQKFDLIFTILPSVIFIIDMYINFNLAYFQNGKLVCNRRQIAANYFFGQYWFDLISIILQISMDKSLLSLIIRIYVIQKELDRVLSTFQIQEKFYYAYRLIRLAMELLLSCHILACTFILAASYSNDNWLTLNQLDSQPNRIKYLNSLYYIIVTTSTIGYGDIHPVSNTEKLFLCFIGFVCSGLFAYNISTISSIVNDSIKQKLDIKRQIFSLTEYMTERQISRSIQNQILQQLYYNMRTQKKQPQVINECLKHVSENLKDSLFNEYFGKILDSNKYMKRKFSKQFRLSLISKFKEEIFSPGQILFQEGEQNERLIYVRSGGVSHYLNYSNPTPIVYEYNKGSWFGFQEFFTGESKNCYAKSKDFTSIVYIERNDFLEVIQSFPRDKEVYFMIRDKVLYSNLKISLNCNICNSMFHTIQKCPYVHFAKKREYIIQKNNYQLISKREPLFRRRQVKYNSKRTNEQVRYQLKNFRMSLLLMAEGCNLFDKQRSANDCDSIIENQQGNNIFNIDKIDADQRFYLSLCNDNQFSDFNLLQQTRQNSNMYAIKSSDQHKGSINDGNYATCTDSPIFRQDLPQTREKKISKFCEDTSKDLENNSPFSSRQTKNSFTYQESEDQSRSTQMKEAMNKDNQQLNSNQIQKQQNKNDPIDINDSLKSQEEEEGLNNEQEDDGFENEVRDGQNKIQFKGLDKNNNNSYKEQNFPVYKNIIEQSNLPSKENSIMKSTQLQKMRKIGTKGGRKITFVLKPQNFNSIIKILPKNVETDYEFYQKYDGIKWENNELQVLKNEQIISQSQSSFYHFEAGNNQDVHNESQNMFIPQQKPQGILTNANQAQQQIIHYNLSVINEEKSYQDTEKTFDNLLPLNQQAPSSNDQQILMKILNQIEQVKQQQIDIRREVNRQNRQHSNANKGVQRAFTFFQQPENDIDLEQKSQKELNGNQAQNEENYFGKQSFEANQEEANNILEKNNSTIERKNPFLNQNESHDKQIDDKQNNDIKIKLQNDNKISFTRPHFQIPHISKTGGSMNYDLSPTQKLGKNISFHFNMNQQQSEENSPAFPTYPNHQQQFNMIKSTMAQSEIKLKDKIEFQFFIAFERQNNWKTYFPIYNLSYITERVIKTQKKKLRFDLDTPLLSNSQTKDKRLTHFRRLSELVIENRERKSTQPAIKQTSQIKRIATGQEMPNKH